MVFGKRGLEIAVTTVIMIILSIAVLTVLILFFNNQTGFLSRWFDTQSSESNVDLIVSSCNTLANTNSVYSYCCDEKEIILGGNEKIFKITCDGAREESWSGDRIKELVCGENLCS